MKAALLSKLLLIVLPIAGCASSPSWRDALADAKHAPLVMRAELMLIAGGDAAQAATLAEQALAEGTDATRAFIVLLAASDALGDGERPLSWFARAVDAAIAADDAVTAERIAAEAGRAWARLDGHDPRSPDVLAALDRIAAKHEAAWEPARARALRERVAGLRLRGDDERAAAEEAGFITTWRLSAPWGEAPALDYRDALGPESRALAAVEMTGAGWGLVATPTTNETFSDGEVTFFDLPTSGGTGFAEARFVPPASAATGRRYILRLETNRLAAVYVDGAIAAQRDDATAPWLTVGHVDLSGDAQRVTVKLTSSDGRGFFRVQMIEVPRGELASRPRVPLTARPGDARAAVNALLEIEELLSRPRWDPARARDGITSLEEAIGPHIALDLLAARVALGDVAAPESERRQLARTRFEAVLARVPDHPVARRGLARIERDEERPDRALALLSDAQDLRSRLDLLDLYRARGWEAESLALADELRASESPRVMQEAIDTYTAFGRYAAAEAVAARLAEAFPVIGAARLYGLDADRGDIDVDLILRAFTAEPQKHASLRAAVQGLRRQGKLALASRLVEAFLTTRPRDGWALSERVRIALQARQVDVATGLIDEALRLTPDFAPLEELRAQLKGAPEPFDEVEDGEVIIARWKAFAASPEGATWAAYPIVNVLERTRTEVRADGSTLELVHRVRLVQTKQGADELGDVRPPDGARVLVVRTLKADGRVLEPERTPGKAELSFSELQPGDAVETAWVTRSRVAPSEGGYLTGIAFAAWGAPIFELDARVSCAPGLVLALTAFGGAPPPTTTTETEARWQLTKLPPVAKEQLAISPRSFFPFVDLRVARRSVAPADRDRAAWLAISRAYAARLMTLSTPGPRVKALAERFRKERDPIAAAFEWVKSEVSDIEQLNAFETPVEAAIANKKGNRALVLAAILDALAIDAQVVLCAPQRDGPPEDRAAPTPNPNRFFYPIVTTAKLSLDPSRPYTPTGDLPAELDGAACLVPSASAFVMRDLHRDAPAPTFETALTLTIDGDGDAHGTLIGLARGAAASPLRQAYLAQDEERQRIIFEQWLASLAVGARLVDFHVDDAEDAEKAMRWRLTIELPGYATRDGDALVVQRPLKTLVHADFAGVNDLAQLVSLPVRTTPLRLLPFSEQVTITLTAPGMKLVAAPPPVTTRGISQTTSDNGDSLVITRSVVITPGRVLPAEYDSFRRDIGGAIRAFDAALRFEPRR